MATYQEQLQAAIERAKAEGYTVQPSLIAEKHYDLVKPSGYRYYLPCFCFTEAWAWEQAYLELLSYWYKH